MSDPKPPWTKADMQAMLKREVQKRRDVEAQRDSAVILITALGKIAGLGVSDKLVRDFLSSEAVVPVSRDKPETVSPAQAASLRAANRELSARLEAAQRAEEIQRDTKGDRIADLKRLAEEQRQVNDGMRRQADIYRTERNKARTLLSKARVLLQSNGIPTKWMDDIPD